MTTINTSKLSSSNSSIDVLPEGTYQGVVYGAWYIGEHKSEWQGKEKTNHKIMCGIELNQTIKSEGDYNGKRYCVFANLNISDFEKSNYFSFIKACDGSTPDKGRLNNLELNTLVGSNVLVETGITAGGKAKFLKASKIMDGMVEMTPENDREVPNWVIEKVISEALNKDEVLADLNSENITPADDLPFD